MDIKPWQKQKTIHMYKNAQKKSEFHRIFFLFCNRPREFFQELGAGFPGSLLVRGGDGYIFWPQYLELDLCTLLPRKVVLESQGNMHFLPTRK